MASWLSCTSALVAPWRTRGSEERRAAILLPPSAGGPRPRRPPALWITSDKTRNGKQSEDDEAEAIGTLTITKDTRDTGDFLSARCIHGDEHQAELADVLVLN